MDGSDNTDNENNDNNPPSDNDGGSATSRRTARRERLELQRRELELQRQNQKVIDQTIRRWENRNLKAHEIHAEARAIFHEDALKTLTSPQAMLVWVALKDGDIAVHTTTEFNAVEWVRRTLASEVTEITGNTGSSQREDPGAPVTMPPPDLGASTASSTADRGTSGAGPSTATRAPAPTEVPTAAGPSATVGMQQQRPNAVTPTDPAAPTAAETRVHRPSAVRDLYPIEEDDIPAAYFDSTPTRQNPRSQRAGQQYGLPYPTQPNRQPHELRRPATQARDPIQEDPGYQVFRQTPAQPSHQDRIRAAIASLSKVHYNNAEQRYAGDEDENLDDKVAVFELACDMQQLPHSWRPTCFPVMLRGRAQLFYKREILPDQRENPDSLEMLVERLRAKFAAPAAQRRWKHEFLGLTYKKMCKSTGTSGQEALKKLYLRLEHLQGLLGEQYAGDERLMDQLTYACRNEEFAARVKAISETSSEAYQELQAQIAWLTRNKEPEPEASLLIGRRRYGPPTQSHPGPSQSSWRRPDNRPRPPSATSNPSATDTGQKIKTCYRCKSTEHLLRDCPEVTSAQRVHLVTVAEQMGVPIEPSPEPEPFPELLEEPDAQQPELPPATDDSDSEPSFYVLEQEEQDAHAEPVLTTGPANQFLGVVFDTGSRSSLVGQRQLDAWAAVYGPVKVRTDLGGRFRFGNDVQLSMGTADILLPLPGGDTWPLSIYVVRADIPMLVGTRDMDRESADVLVSKRTLAMAKRGLRVPLQMVNGQLLYVPDQLTWLTRDDVQKAHRAFGHCHPERLTRVIRSAGAADDMDIAQLRSMISDVTNQCDVCAKHATPPRVRQVSAPDVNAYNDRVYIDLMYIDGHPVLHMVDAATRFAATRVLPDKSTKTVWNTFFATWCLQYCGVPDAIYADSGNEFTADFFRERCDHHGVHLTIAPIEAHWAIGLVERQHQTLRDYVKRIQSDTASFSLSRAVALATFSVNATVNSGGNTPCQLVFGQSPRLPGLPNTAQRPDPSTAAEQRHVSQTAFDSTLARRQWSRAMRARPPHERGYSLKTGDRVLVFRETTSTWEGPHTHIGTLGARSFLLVKERPVEFSTSVVRPSPDNTGSTPENELPDAPVPEPTTPVALSYDSATPVFVAGSDDDPAFDDAKTAEIHSLVRSGTLLPVDNLRKVDARRIIGARFVLTTKSQPDGTTKYKARLVAQGHRDPDKASLLSTAPTARKQSNRLLLSFSKKYSWDIWTRDIARAFQQSMQALGRKLFLRMRDGNGYQVLKPIYGLPEGALAWYETYASYLIKDCGMVVSTADPCLFFLKEGGVLHGMICLHVDDSLCAGDELFRKTESRVAERFRTNPVTTPPLRFAGLEVAATSTSFTLAQSTYESEQLLDHPLRERTTKALQQYIGKLLWISCNVRADLAYLTSQMGQSLKDPARAETLAAEVHKHLLANRGLQLPFRRLRGKLRLAVYGDASFATNADHTSQLGYLVFLADEHNTAHLLAWHSRKSTRVTRSILAAELFAVNQAFDMAVLIQHCIKELTGDRHPLHVHTDSKSVYDAMATSNVPEEKRLVIDLQMLRNAYSSREIQRMVLVPGPENPSDVLTKRTSNKVLTEWYATGQLNHSIRGYMDDASH